ncbi:hypothetical protein D3C84_1079330 [compost metagenome]
MTAMLLLAHSFWAFNYIPIVCGVGGMVTHRTVNLDGSEVFDKSSRDGVKLMNSRDEHCQC